MIINDEFLSLTFKCTITRIINSCNYQGEFSEAYVEVEYAGSKLLLFDDDLIIPICAIGHKASLTLLIFPCSEIQLTDEEYSFYKCNDNYENEIVASYDKEIGGYYRLRIDNQAFLINKLDLKSFEMEDVKSKKIRFNKPRIDVCFAQWPRGDKDIGFTNLTCKQE